MAVSGLSGIESMLSQCAPWCAPRSGGATEAELAPGPSGFAAELQRSIRSVSQAQNAASDQAKAFELGAPGISLNDVMIDLQKGQFGLPDLGAGAQPPGRRLQGNLLDGGVTPAPPQAGAWGGRAQVWRTALGNSESTAMLPSPKRSVTGLSTQKWMRAPSAVWA